MSGSSSWGGVEVSRDQERGEWFVCLSPDCPEINYQSALNELCIKDAELIEHGVTEDGDDYMIFADIGTVA